MALKHFQRYSHLREYIIICRFVSLSLYLSLFLVRSFNGKHEEGRSVATVCDAMRCDDDDDTEKDDGCDGSQR